jgi:hypothetical protein
MAVCEAADASPSAAKSTADVVTQSAQRSIDTLLLSSQHALAKHGGDAGPPRNTTSFTKQMRRRSNSMPLP